MRPLLICMLQATCSLSFPWLQADVACAPGLIAARRPISLSADRTNRRTACPHRRPASSQSARRHSSTTTVCPSMDRTTAFVPPARHQLGAQLVRPNIRRRPVRLFIAMDAPNVIASFLSAPQETTPHRCRIARKRCRRTAIGELAVPQPNSMGCVSKSFFHSSCPTYRSNTDRPFRSVQ